MKREDLNIMNNIKVIEDLKADLLVVIADFFKLLSKGSNVAEDALVSCISGAIISLYLLAGRLGFTYLMVDENIKKNIKEGIKAGDDVERDGRDLTKLYEYLKNRN